MDFYERVEVLRKERKMSQADLEKALGISNGSVSKWKKSFPTYDRLEKVANFFDVTVKYLVEGVPCPIEEKARLDAKLTAMDETTKEYALKLSNLSEKDKEFIFNAIDRFLE